MSAMLLSGKDLMTGMFMECSPPIPMRNFPSSMAGFTANWTSEIMSSGRTKSSTFP